MSKSLPSFSLHWLDYPNGPIRGNSYHRASRASRKWRPARSTNNSTSLQQVLNNLRIVNYSGQSSPGRVRKPLEVQPTRLARENLRIPAKGSVRKRDPLSRFFFCSSIN